MSLAISLLPSGVLACGKGHPVIRPDERIENEGRGFFGHQCRECQSASVYVLMYRPEGGQMVPLFVRITVARGTIGIVRQLPVGTTLPQLLEVIDTAFATASR